MTKIVTAIFIIVAPFSGEIMLRSTFESWEGTLSQSQWVISGSRFGGVTLENEDESNPDYQMQSHGQYSIRIHDPDDTSFANARNFFKNGSSEYMVEFYIWIPHTHTATDFFPLCILRDAASKTRSYKTDVALIVDAIEEHVEGRQFVIHVEDARGVHFGEAYIDSTDRWYKIQLHRHSVQPHVPIVEFYLDGELKGTYSPINAERLANMILLGTTSADSLNNGDIFYDDIIITAPPVGRHPRLLFDDNDLLILRARMASEESTYIGLTHKQMWDSLITYGENWIDGRNFLVWRKGTIIDTYYFPYRQFTLHPRDGEDHRIELWLGPQRIVASALLGLSFVSAIDTSLIEHRYHAESLLVSLSHWQTWNDPYFHRGSGEKYMQLGGGHFMYSVALSYDWLYNFLSPYERMSVQNTLINFGINQTYLETIDGSWGKSPRKWPNAAAVMIGGMGISCLALDNAGLQDELNSASSRIGDLLSDYRVCDPTGGYAEGISYAGYAVDFLVTFTEAERTLGYYTSSDFFLKNYADYRIWCMLPGAEQYYDELCYPPTYWDVTFCDYDRRGGQWTTAIARLAEQTHNPEARWFMEKRKDIRFSEKGSQRWDLYLPFGLFLWIEGDGSISMPNPDTLLKVFPAIGWVIARTGWQDAADYILAVKSGPWYSRHNHHEQGSFIFGGKGRWLVADMGYTRKDIHKNARYHNVLFEANSESLYCRDHDLRTHFSTNEQYSFVVSRCYSAKSGLGLWERNILFFNKSGSFVVMDYAGENQDVDSIAWQIHTWAEPLIASDSIIKISYDNGPRLLCHILYPKDVTTTDNVVSSVYIRETIDTTTIKHNFHRIQADLATKTTDTFSVLVGFVPYACENEVELTSINGVNLRGLKMKNSRGCAAALFSSKDSILHGEYRLSSSDSLLNVICNLIPDENYLVTTQIGTDSVATHTVYTDSSGIISFVLFGVGDWRVTFDLIGTDKSD